MSDTRAPAGAQERATASEILRRRYAGDDLVRQAAIDAERAAIPPVCDLPPAKYGCELYAGHEGPCRARVGTAEEVSWLAPQPQGDRAALVERLEWEADFLEKRTDLCRVYTKHLLREAARALASPAEASEPRSRWACLACSEKAGVVHDPARHVWHWNPADCPLRAERAEPVGARDLPMPVDLDDLHNAVTNETQAEDLRRAQAIVEAYAALAAAKPRGSLYWATDPAWPCPTCGHSVKAGFTMRDVELLRWILQENPEIATWDAWGQWGDHAVNSLADRILAALGAAAAQQGESSGNV